MPDITNTPIRIALTKKRLWYLYCFRGCIKREIEEKTGWTRGQIDGGIRRWDLSYLAEASILTREWMREGLIAAARSKGQLDPQQAAHLLTVDVQAMGRRLAEKQPMSWTEIDAMPWPRELEPDESARSNSPDAV